MAKKHMKKCSPSLAIKEMQTKTTLRFNVTLLEQLSSKIPPTTGVGEDVGRKELCILLVGMQAMQPLWKTTWRLLKKLNIALPYDLAIPLLGIYPKECDSGYSSGTCTPMFTAALFTIAKLWKQSRCPTTDE
jgi:hypothetical protein